MPGEIYTRITVYSLHKRDKETRVEFYRRTFHFVHILAS